jgi:MYXO-CTERM domain-containing protein
MRIRIHRNLVLSIVVSTLLWSLPAAAQENYNAPFIELGLGATNIQATTGNGDLTAGVSKDGDLTVLSWPSPTYYDQLHYITTNDPDARQQPRFGAPKRAGAFAGLIVQEQGASETEVTYFRNWETRNITYLEDDAGVVVTRFEHDDLGLTVRQYDLIPKNRDVLIRRYRIEVTGDTQFETLDLLSYSNLTPSLSKVPQVPLLDVLMDHYNDFMGVWRSEDEAIVQFHPEDNGVVRTLGGLLDVFLSETGPSRDFGPIGELLKNQDPTGSELNDLTANLDDHYAEGVYAAMSSKPAPKAHQIGQDRTEFCKRIDELVENVQELAKNGGTLPAPPAAAKRARCADDFDPVDTVRENNDWSYEAEDAFTDAKDGELNGTPVAAGQVNTALRVPIELEDGSGEASLYYAFGSTTSKSLETLEWAKGRETTSIQQSIVQADQSFVDSLWIPEEVDGELRKFIVRSFLNLRVGTDEQTGAIVASISRQPSYQLDWPRDGAFFNVALDLSGQHELVTKRMDFYSKAMRKEKKQPFPLLNNGLPGWPSASGENNFPPHSWEMNYYADAVPGGNIRMEIDNSALLVWSYVAHAGHLEGEARSEYIRDVWPTVRKATEFIHSWKDPETNLMWPANEDDHAEYTQGLQGANTSYLALNSAARMARHLGKNELASKWVDRADELRQATIDLMYKPDEGYFIDYGEEGRAAGRAWMGWPTHFLDYDDPRLKQSMTRLLKRQLESVKGERGNNGYPTKAAISAAIVLDDEEKRKQALEIAERLAEEIANDDTWTIGESIVPVDEDGDGETDSFINGVSTPHLWSSTLVYLTAVAYYNPEKFDQYRQALGPARAGGGDAGLGGDAGSGSAPSQKGGGGCGCTQSNEAPGPIGGLLVWMLGLLGLRFGRRRLIRDESR